jgi:hypothetical protein
VTQIRHDWPAASASLEDLIALQGPATQAVNWGQWVRVLRCMGDDARAMSVAAQGLATHPKDAQLQEEFNALQRVGITPVLKVARWHAALISAAANAQEGAVKPL